MIPFATQDAAAEPSRLAAVIADQAKALVTDDCAAACKALDSMRRSVQRLCELEPGARCEEARKTLADSERRVVAACPVCVRSPPPPPEDRMAKAEAAPLPASERAPRGCGGCEAGTAPGDASIFVLATLSLLARLRRRRA